MAKIIVYDQGRANTFLAGIADEDILAIAPHGDGKILIAVKGESSSISPSDSGIIDVTKYEKQIEEMAKAIEDCKLRCDKEIEAKEKEIGNLKKQLQSYIQENTNLNKELEKCKNQAQKEIEKLKKAVADFTV